jgi:hypothetical protein
MISARYSDAIDQATIGAAHVTWSLDNYYYDLKNFFQPLIGQLIAQLNQATGDPIAALLNPDFLNGLTTQFFSSDYQVNSDPSIHVTSYPKAIDLDGSLPYANYNMELVYHIPVAVAVYLSQHGRFAEAQKWFHYVFDPTSKDMLVAPPARYWKCLYFRNNPVAASLTDLLTLMSTPDSQLQPTPLIPDPSQAKQDIINNYNASCTTAFEPFVVARGRASAFQYYVVMKYLDNLIAWGDSLFSQMTIETVNEATLCYVLAANLLGPRPEQVPPVGAVTAKCYNDLKNQPGGLDPMGNALVALEGQLPFNIVTPAGAATNQTGPLFNMGRTLYFCVPQNAQLLGYWDTVQDRLTKIRSCENIQGQVQPMPLFDAPIDPGMLVAAAAAGLDLGSAVSGLNQPIGPFRAQVLIAKATEMAAEVRSLGASLLSAIEKGEAEHLAQLRQSHEVAVQQSIQNVRYLQWQQAQAATEALLRSRASALERYTYYLRLLNQAPDPATAPGTFTIDHTFELTEENFGDAYQSLVGQYDLPVTMQAYPAIQQPSSASPAVQSGAAGAGQLYLNANEDAELNEHMPAARDARLAASVYDIIASVLTFIPEFNVALEFWGLGGDIDVFGGKVLSDEFKIMAEILRTQATWEQDQGGMAARKAGYQRRADDWLLQANLAARELSQIGRQLLTSIIAEQAAYHEYTTAQTQASQSQEVLDYLQSKFTNEDLYTWMSGQLSSLLYSYYRLALDTARRAEATMKAELMRPELDATTYIQPTYWDAGHQGLLSGEPLFLDVKRLDLDYHTYDVRELEITSHVSLRQLQPTALLALKLTGTCTVTIPEWFYDLHCPGHYMRRLDMVSVSIPSTVGSLASVNCTLALQQSSIRTSSQAAQGQYARSATTTDSRFTDYYGSIQSIVTSGAVSDSGMFDTSVRDDRYRPFEGAGAISTWTLTLPPIPSFGYATITDVILHVRYTARDGGQALAGPATDATRTLLKSGGAPQYLLLSLRHDFPTQWYAFTSGGGTQFTAVLPRSYFPYTTQGATLGNIVLTLYSAAGQVTPPVPATMATDLNTAGETTLSFTADAKVLSPQAADVFLVIQYALSGA